MAVANDSVPASEVRRLLILRPDNLGDAVLFSGALRHLQSRFPAAEIAICVKPVVRELLERSPFVDEIVAWDTLRPHWPERLRRVRGLPTLARAAHDLWLRRRYDVDLALLPVVSPSPEMRRVLRTLSASRKYDITGSAANESLIGAEPAPADSMRSLHLTGEDIGRHELSVTRSFLQMLGIDVDESELWPEFWTSPGDVVWAADAVQPRVGRTTLVLAPGVTAPPGKAYPIDGYLRAISNLSTPALDVVLLGTPADQDVCARLAVELADSPGVARVKDLAGRTTIGRMIECVRLADVVLGPDSATLHVAVALRKPTVCILGGGQPGRFQPWGSPELNYVAVKPMDCFGCDWKCRYETMRCVQELDPLVVRDQLARALNGVVRIA